MSSRCPVASKEDLYQTNKGAPWIIQPYTATLCDSQEECPSFIFLFDSNEILAEIENSAVDEIQCGTLDQSYDGDQFIAGLYVPPKLLCLDEV